MCRQGHFPGPQEWSTYLYFSRAQLLPLALPLECLGENKARIVLHLFWGAPKSLQMMTAAMKLKDTYSLEGKL